MTISPETIEALAGTFKKVAPTTVKNTKPCRIKFCGNFITTCSGKTIWRNIGFAKSALLNHFNSVNSSVVSDIVGGSGVYTNQDGLKQLIKDLTKLGIIEFVEADTVFFANQRKKN